MDEGLLSVKPDVGSLKGQQVLPSCKNRKVMPIGNVFGSPKPVHILGLIKLLSEKCELSLTQMCDC
jgi:hypothetical protein